MKYLPTRYQHVYLTGAGHFLPGEAVNNAEMDNYIAPLNSQSQRIKRRILAENGIEKRHYAINTQGETVYSASRMAAGAVKHCLQHAGKQLEEITLLATGSAGGDVMMPGVANMLQGELLASPMETRSHHGVCASGIHALKDAANMVDNGSHQQAMVAAVEFPSRLFKQSRFTPLEYNVDFDAHFLRWMLSDGAGACCVSSSTQSANSLALKVEWIHSKSFSGDFPTCMQLGGSKDSEQSYLDSASFAEAEAKGSLLIRQDIRLLPQLFEVAVHEYAELVKQDYVDPQQVDHFLCHYSSQRLGEQADELMQQAGLGISREKWYSNLTQRGNTGSASIFIMLSEFWRSQDLKPGERIFCFIPESGRFTVSYMMLTVVEAQNQQESDEQKIIAPPHSVSSASTQLMRETLQELAGIWHDYRSTVWRTPLVQTILKNEMELQQYRQWMACWIPQVREGSQWMRKAILHLPDELQSLGELIETHANEEQDDYRVLYEDYLAAGGECSELDRLQRNPGGEALNAYIHSVAGSTAAVGLLGAIYIIEGTGQRIIPALLPKLRQQLPLTEKGFRFLRYHGENDIAHLARWLQAVSMVLCTSQENAAMYARSIIRTARHVAQLYRLQWESVYE